MHSSLRGASRHDRPSSEHLTEPDIVRGVAIIAVVAIHASAIAQSRMSAVSPLYAVYVTLTYVSLFAVPAFIFISGLVLAHVYREGIPSYGTFLSRRIASIGAPYVIWSLFYYLYSARASHLPFGLAWLGGLTKALLLGTAFYHLYFVVIILQMYLLFPAILGLVKCLDSGRTGVLIPFGLVHAAYLWFLARFPFPYSDRFFLTYLVFFAVGTGIGLRIKEFRNMGARSRSLLGGVAVLGGLAYVGFSLAAIVYRYSSPATVLPSLWSAYSLAVGASLLAIAPWTSKPLLSGLGRHSFGIYLAHPIILVIADGALTWMGVRSTSLRFLIEWSVALGGAALLTRLAHRFRLGRLVFGR